jgi:two-component system, OmpR family, sensor histidine kinase VicK
VRLKGQRLNSKGKGEEGEVNTHIIHGAQDVIKAEEALFYSATKTIDSCMTYTRPSLAIALPQIRIAFVNAKKRGIKLRYITEITRENLSYCKELRGLVDELRHFDGIRNNFMVSEREYLAPLVLSDGKAIASELVYSNVVQLVEQAEYIFENLWTKSSSAEKRIAELDEGKITPVTEVIYGAENTLAKGVTFMKNVTQKMDIFFDAVAPSIVIEIAEYRNGYADIRRRGGRIRAFTDITKENLVYCKELLKVVDELRHIDGIKGGIAISEIEYMASTVMQEGERLPEVIYSNVKEIVEQGQYIFDTLWSKGIPAIERIRALEEGLPAEKTEVFYGEEQVVGAIIRWQYASEKSWNLCLDSTLPSFSMSERIRKGYPDARARGVRIRYITQITRENLEYCKDIMNFAELRHLEGLVGNFVVSEKEYLGEASGKEFFSHLIYSNKKEIAEHQSYIFENLWDNAIPAAKKIMEIVEGVVPYETKILANYQEITKQINHLTETSSGLSIVSSYGGMQLINNNFLDLYEKLLEKYHRGEGRGIKWVMTINKESIELVRKFLELGVKIRHVKNLTPISFAVGEHELNATLSEMIGGKMVENLLTSNEPIYVRLFTSMFEELWREGVDAEYRIRDVEEGVNVAEIEIIQNPVDAIDRCWDLAKSANKEIDTLFSSTNAFKRQAKMGALQELKNASEDRQVAVRLMVPSSDNMGEFIEKTQLSMPKVNMRTISASLGTRISILVVDKKECLILELKDDSQKSSYEAVGLSIYSKSPSIVSSYLSVFESFWKQAELYEKMKEVETLEKDFINLAAHELRTPIQPIIGFSELLSSKLKNREEKQLLEGVIKNARRLQKLADSMLDVTRIERHSFPLRKEVFDIRELVIDLVEQYNTRRSEEVTYGGEKEGKMQKIARNDRFADLKIMTNLQEREAKIDIMADKGRITQVISNMLDNAVKFTGTGCIYVNLKIEIEEGGGGQQFVTINVKDEGQGIDPELLPRVFTKFVSMSELGTGLGLFIAKAIIEEHGGKIWAKNNSDGPGATLGFSLPLIKA